MSETLDTFRIKHTEDNVVSKEVVKQLLQQKSFASQSEICKALNEMGYTGINQSRISRWLSQLGVTKGTNSNGRRVYCVTSETAPVKVNSAVSSQIEFVTHNQMMVVVKTNPASAQLVARMIDTEPHPEILGTVGGNDTVLVIPHDVGNIVLCENIVRKRLGLQEI
ncbi:arginine repressor [Vibrio hippocampi]|uniref:Arginine repressor n=1 Tax=Vibrio hippocampi TaxID=654686 RepID=A0ABM8ZNC8_9VIBR|nr:arginine repressor [Vibrio hippocampi]CAH0529811.1 Arginine repressor [Vibrio hippocampi]